MGAALNGHAGDQLVGRGSGRAGVPPNPGPGTPRRSGDPTAATCSNGTRTLEGTVESVNERGVKVGGRWLNYSKWPGEIAEPRRGQAVALTLDGSGFVRAVGPADGSTEHCPAGGTGAGPSKDATIARLAILKAAAAFAAGRPGLKSGDVLAIAERWEGWVGR